MRQIGRVERLVRQADSFQQRHAVIAFPWAVMQKFGNDQAGSKAALMAYYGLFALFPLLLLLATVLGFALSGNAALRNQLIDSALGNFPVIGDQLRSEVHPLEGNTTALVIGIVGNPVWLLRYRLRVAERDEHGLEHPVRPLAQLRGNDTCVPSASSACSGWRCSLPPLLATIATAVAHGAGSQSPLASASALVNLGLFLLAFMVLTAEPLRVRDVALGAILATVFWETLQLIGTWYVTRGLQKASPTYGVFAVVITLLSWLYLGSQLTLWAAEINVVLRYRLWPRSVTQPPLTKADRLVFIRLAQMEVRRPEVEVTASFTDEADENPLEGTP